MTDKPQTPTQSTQTFFLPDRRLLGAIWVIKRVMIALTLGSLFDGNPMLTAVFIGIREGLSALTDYSSARNPVSSATQTSPPAPEVTTPINPETPAS